MLLQYPANKYWNAQNIDWIGIVNFFCPEIWRPKGLWNRQNVESKAKDSYPSSAPFSLVLCVNGLTVRNINNWFPSPAGNSGMPLMKLFLARNTSAPYGGFPGSVAAEGCRKSLKSWSIPGRESMISQDSRLVTGDCSLTFLSIYSFSVQLTQQTVI
jgi:hypothetical protein